MHAKWVWALAALVAVLGVTAGASGSVPKLIDGKQIKPYSVTSLQMVNHTLQKHDLSQGLVDYLRSGSQGPQGAVGPAGSKGDAGVQGPKGVAGDTGAQGKPGLSDLEAAGPYPGATQLVNGANSTELWKSDPTGSTLQSSWVECAGGKVALGGGYGWDDVQTSKLVIVTSTPFYVDPGTGTTALGGAYKMHDTQDYSMVPNAWLVQGYNMSGQDIGVRPWVICAKIAS